MEGFVAVKYDTLNYYIGEYKNNEKNGFGYHHFPNKLVYKGKYENGKKVAGIVIDPFTLENGRPLVVYEGSWGNDTYNGQGTLTKKTKQQYIGSFLDGEFHGKGKMLWPNGDQYEGDFVNNSRDGKGEMIFANKDRYKGGFKGNKFNGYGEYYWSGGDVYRGNFVNGIMEKGDVNFQIGIVGSGIWSEKDIRYELT